MSENPGTTTPDAIVEARMAELTTCFGDRLTDEQEAQVRARIANSLELAEAVRRNRFANADEPEIVFAPYRREDTR